MAPVDAVAAKDVFASSLFTVRAKLASLSWIDIPAGCFPVSFLFVPPDTGVSNSYVTGVITDFLATKLPQKQEPNAAWVARARSPSSRCAER
jgi:hypothetical protein